MLYVLLFSACSTTGNTTVEKVTPEPSSVVAEPAGDSAVVDTSNPEPTSEPSSESVSMDVSFVMPQDRMKIHRLAKDGPRKQLHLMGVM